VSYYLNTVAARVTPEMSQAPSDIIIHGAEEGAKGGKKRRKQHP
jgi:hypothetical protein